MDTICYFSLLPEHRITLGDFFKELRLILSALIYLGDTLEEGDIGEVGD